MLNEFAYAGDGDPHDALSRARDLVRRVRAAQRATWFPLLVFAAVIFAAIPVQRYSGYHVAACKTFPVPPDLGGLGRACFAYSDALFVYWPIALILAYVAIAAFYAYKSRERGVGTTVRPYVIAGIVLAVVLTGAALWAAYHVQINGAGLVTDSASTVIVRLASPVSAVGIALLVLAWAERNLALLVFTLGYLLIVLTSVTFGWVLNGHWGFMPRLVIAGSLLLAGAVGFALGQRPALLSAA